MRDGCERRDRLTFQPDHTGEQWPDRRLAPHVGALDDPATGLAREDASPAGLPWQEPDGGWGQSAGRTDLHVTIDSQGRTADRRTDFEDVYGDWAEIAGRIEPPPPAVAPPRSRPPLAA